MSCKSPIFIIGNPRSGTTLLRLMMTCHSNIVIPPESGFAIWWKQKYGNFYGVDWQSPALISKCLDDILSSKKIEYWNLDKTELLNFLSGQSITSYAELVDGIYKFYVKKAGKTNARWGDKNNFYLSSILEIHELFPNAHFIHIVRDPRDVACSYKSLKNIKGKYSPQLPGTVGLSAKQWVENIQLIRSCFAQLSWTNVLEIHFEHLVENPEFTLEEVCKFLGESFDKGMLNYPSLNKMLMLEPSEFLKWKANTLQAPKKDMISKFNQELSQMEISQVEEITGNLMKIYGYN